MDKGLLAKYVAAGALIASLYGLVFSHDITGEQYLAIVGLALAALGIGTATAYRPGAPPPPLDLSPKA